MEEPNHHDRAILIPEEGRSPPRVITVNIQVPKMPKALADMKNKKKKAYMALGVVLVITFLIFAGRPIVEGVSDLWPRFLDWINSKKQPKFDLVIRSIDLPLRDRIFENNPSLNFDRTTESIMVSFSAEIENATLESMGFRYKTNADGQGLTLERTALLKTAVGNEIFQCALSFMHVGGERLLDPKDAEFVCRSEAEEKVWASLFGNKLEIANPTQESATTMGMGYRQYSQRNSGVWQWQETIFCGLWEEHSTSWLCAAYFDAGKGHPILLLKSTDADELSVNLPARMTADLKVGMHFTNSSDSRMTVAVFGFISTNGYRRGYSKAGIILYDFSKDQFGQFRLTRTKHSELSNHLQYGLTYRSAYMSWTLDNFANAKLTKWAENWALLWQEGSSSGKFDCNNNIFTVALLDENLEYVNIKQIKPRDIEGDDCSTMKNRYEIWAPHDKGGIFGAIELAEQQIFFVLRTENDWSTARFQDKLVAIKVILD